MMAQDHERDRSITRTCLRCTRQRHSALAIGVGKAAEFRGVLVKILGGGFGQARKPHQLGARKFSRGAAETPHDRPT